MEIEKSQFGKHYGINFWIIQQLFKNHSLIGDKINGKKYDEKKNICKVSKYPLKGKNSIFVMKKLGRHKFSQVIKVNITYHNTHWRLVHGTEKDTSQSWCACQKCTTWSILNMRKRQTNANWETFYKIIGQFSFKAPWFWKIKKRLWRPITHWRGQKRHSK